MTAFAEVGEEYRHYESLKKGYCVKLPIGLFFLG